MTRFEIEVFADTCCPFTYLGKRHLDAAVKQWTASQPGDVFDIVWKPFYLFPNAKPEGKVALSLPPRPLMDLSTSAYAKSSSRLPSRESPCLPAGL
jgi:predicted DsbA family dithiol-disulfide isomerase